MASGGGSSADEAPKPILRSSCVECTSIRRRCVGPGPPEECDRCVRLSLVCIFEVAKKRGPPPRTQHIPKETNETEPSKKQERKQLKKAANADTGTTSSALPPPPPPPSSSAVSAPKRGTGTKAPRKPRTTATNVPDNSFIFRDETAKLAAKMGQSHAGVTITFPTMVNIGSLAEGQALPGQVSVLLVPGPMLPPARVGPSLPPPEVANSLLANYLGPRYLSFQLGVRPELKAELQQGQMPDILLAALILYSAWGSRFNAELDSILGVQGRVRVVNDCLELCRITVSPAIEQVEATSTLLSLPVGPNFSQQTRRALRRRAVGLVLALAHLLALGLQLGHRAPDPMLAMDGVLSLAVRAARAARITETVAYDEEDTVAPAIPPLLERARRVWWALVGMDQQIAIMHNIPARISAAERITCPLNVSEGEYEARLAASQAAIAAAAASLKAGSGLLSSVSLASSAPSQGVATGSASTQSPAGAASQASPPKPRSSPFDMTHLYPFSNASLKMLADLGSNSGSVSGSEQNSSGSQSSGLPTIPGSDDTSILQQPPQPPHPQLITSIGPRGFDPVIGYMRLLFMFGNIADQPKPGSAADLEAWFEELPQPWKDANTKVLRGPGIWALHEPQARTSREEIILMNKVGQLMLIYHAANVLVSSPPGGFIGPIDTAWLGSPHFLHCQEHAIRATEVLRNFLLNPTEQLAGPFFQFTTVLTGFAHVAYIKAAKGAADAQLARQAAAELSVHTAVLKLGAVDGLGFPAESYWNKTWLRVLAAENLM